MTSTGSPLALRIALSISSRLLASVNRQIPDAAGVMALHHEAHRKARWTDVVAGLVSIIHSLQCVFELCCEVYDNKGSWCCVATTIYASGDMLKRLQR